jgi:hypothetical protein
MARSGLSALTQETTAMGLFLLRIGRIYFAFAAPEWRQDSRAATATRTMGAPPWTIAQSVKGAKGVISNRKRALPAADGNRLVLVLLQYR